MLQYLAIAALSLAMATIACRQALKWKTICRFVAHFLKNRGSWGLLRKLKLEDHLRPEGVEEMTTPSGFRLLTVKELFEAGTIAVHDLQLRDDDVFIVTYPKSRSFWTQEIVWLLCNNTDTKAAIETMSTRIPCIEYSNWWSHFKAWPQGKQRIMRSHLPYEALPKQIREGRKCKIIYVARNPKDACVANFFLHQTNLLLPHPGSWSEFLSEFMQGKLYYGSWFPHVLTFWKKHQQGDARIHFTTYENLKRDTKKELVALAKFLEKDLSDNQLERIAHVLQPSCTDKLKKFLKAANLMGNVDAKKLFMRKGLVGDWKNHFTLNQNEAFDEMYREEMKDSGLEMIFEL